MGKPKLSNRKIATIKRLYTVEKIGIPGIVKAVGVSPPTIIRYLRLFGVMRNKKEAIEVSLKKKYLEFETDVVKLYESGLTMDQIGKELFISTTSVYKILKRRKIKSRHSGNRIDPAKFKRIFELYNLGATIEEVSKIYGVTRQAIEKILYKWHNIQSAKNRLLGKIVCLKCDSLLGFTTRQIKLNAVCLKCKPPNAN